MRPLSVIKPLIATLVFCAFNATATTAMDRREFRNVSPEVREWFEHLRSPKGAVCCSYADGHRTGYEMKQYWVPIEGKWYPVPPEAIVHTANPIGEAIVWYLPRYVDGMASNPIRGGKWKIFCFLPSGEV